jgi:hypothetical protein
MVLRAAAAKKQSGEIRKDMGSCCILESKARTLQPRIRILSLNTVRNMGNPAVRGRPQGQATGRRASRRELTPCTNHATTIRLY